MCEQLINCSFFKENESDENMKYALIGFKNRYCNGELKDKCVRLKLAKSYGPSKVPSNMMPSGLPIAGTNDSEWKEEIKKGVLEK